MAGRYRFYTYVIQSLSHPDQRYIGHTADRRQRDTDHNTGKCPHTAEFMPWKLKFYIAFESTEQAQHFEKYLKSGPGTFSQNGISGTRAIIRGSLTKAETTVRLRSPAPFRGRSSSAEVLAPGYHLTCQGHRGRR